MSYTPLLSAALVALTLSACGTTTPAPTADLQAQRIKPAPTPPPSTPFPLPVGPRLYTLNIQKSNTTLNPSVEVSTTPQANHPGYLRATLHVDKASYLNFFPTSAAVAATYPEQQVTSSGPYGTPVTYPVYNVAAAVGFLPNGNINVLAGTPIADSVDKNQLLLNLVGKLNADNSITGLLNVAGTTPVTFWSGSCSYPQGSCRF